MVDAIHFAPADRPDRPQFEALLAQGRFAGLYDEELVSLLAGAAEIEFDETDQNA